MFPDPNEIILRRAVLAGDEEAWRSLYEAHFGWLYRYVLLRNGRDAHVTQDLVQEIWLVAVKRIGRFDPQRAPLRAWLKGVADKVMANHFRRAKHRNTVGLDEHGHQGKEAPSLNGEAVDLALAALPADYQKALLARYKEERSVTEVAEKLNLTYKAAESLLTRARAAFRQAYNELENEP